MLIHELIYIFGLKVPTISFFIFFGVLFWFFLMWREGKKDGFNVSKLFDMSFLIALVALGVVVGLSRYYHWFSLYKPNNWLLKYDLELTAAFLAFFGAVILIAFLSRLWKWSSYRIFDIFAVSTSFLFFSLSLGKYLIYGSQAYLVFFIFLSVMYAVFFRFRGYKFTSGYLFSLFLLFLSLSILALFNKSGYLLFSLVLFTIGVLNFILRRRIIMDKKSLPKEFVENVKKKLLSKEEKLKQEELLLKEEDPYLRPGRTEDNADMVDDAILEDRAKEVLDSRLSLIETIMKQVQRALAAINLGTYGKCEKCGKKISRARLKAYPETTLCIHCAK